MDPFGSGSKSSGPNLPPLDPSKFQSSKPPAKKPLPGADKPAATPGHSPAKSDAGKSAAKPTAKPAEKPAVARGEPNVVLGVVGAVVGALVGAGLWFAVMKIAGRPAGFMALLLGSLAGFGARTLGRATTPVLGGAACISALVAIVVMVWLALGRNVDAKFAPQLATQFKAAVDRAQAALDAKTDAELRPFVQQTMQVADMEGAKVTPEWLKTFREVELPKMRAFLADKNARAKFDARLSSQYRSAYPLDEAWDETFGMLGLLWIVGGVLGAAKLGMK